MKYLMILGLLFLSVVASAQQQNKNLNGIDLNDKSFPWELVIDRGRILGCIYDNTFYSLGSILVLDSLPRKCAQASDRQGIWQLLEEAEMVLYKENIEMQHKLEEARLKMEKEAVFVGEEPISPLEVRVIRYLRGMKEISDRTNKVTVIND